MSTAMLGEREGVGRRFIGLAQAAAHAGLSVSTLRGWLRDRRLTAYQPAAKILVDVQQLDELILRSAKA